MQSLLFPYSETVLIPTLKKVLRVLLSRTLKKHEKKEKLIGVAKQNLTHDPEHLRRAHSIIDAFAELEQRRKMEQPSSFLKRQRSLDQLESSQERTPERPSLTFKPSINRRSSRLDPISRHMATKRGSRHDFLFREAQLRKEGNSRKGSEKRMLILGELGSPIEASFGESQTDRFS